VPGTVGNWLRDYLRNLGTGKIEKVKQAEYLTNSENTKNLTPQDRERITKLFDLYEFLKLSAVTPEGVVEDILFIDRDGKHKILEGIQIKELDSLINSYFGRITPRREVIEEREKERRRAEILRQIKAAPKPKREVPKLKEEIIKIYQGDPKEQEEILKEERILKEKIEKLEPEKREKELEKILESSLDQRNKIRTIALLQILAERQAFDKLLTESSLRFIPGKRGALNQFLEFLKQKEEERPGLLEGFRLEPTAPHYLSLFLQFLLREKLGLDENDSGRVGMQLVNTFKKNGVEKYSQLVYFDVKEEKFKWNV